MHPASVKSGPEGLASATSAARLRLAPRLAPRAARAIEFAALYCGVPLAVLATGAGWKAAPFAAGAMLWTAVALLSMSRGFHWRDLAPRDALSEWRVLLGAAAFLGLGAAAAGFAEGGALHRASSDCIAALAVWPLVLAIPSELFFRALLFRRYGALLRHDAVGVAASGAAFGLLHLALGCTAAEAVYWSAAGATIAAVYRLTGQFWLTVALNAVAGVALATLCSCAH